MHEVWFSGLGVRRAPKARELRHKGADRGRCGEGVSPLEDGVWGAPSPENFLNLIFEQQLVSPGKLMCHRAKFHQNWPK